MIAPVAATVVVLILVGLASAVVRYRRSAGIERLQMREVLWAAVLTVVGFVLISVLSAREFLYNLDYLLIPAAVGLAMLRYRLYDVDVIIRRTLTYAALVATLAVIYLAGIALIGGLLREPGRPVERAGGDALDAGGGGRLPAAAGAHPDGSSTVASTAPPTTAAPPSTPSAAACASRSTWTRYRRSCWRRCRARCSRPRPASGCVP